MSLGDKQDPNVYVIYRNNPKAWMTGVLFMEWLTSFNAQIVQRGRKVLLLLDNASSHDHIPELSNVTMKFLPPNTTAHLQPMDGGIIQNLKSFYCRYQSQHYLRCLESDIPLTVNVREAITLVFDSWRDVTSATIANCWRHVGILPAAEAVVRIAPNKSGQQQS